MTAEVAAQDTLTIGNGTSCQVFPVGTTAAPVPVYIRDVAGTPLGMDKPAGTKLQAFGLQVSPNPASHVAVDSAGRLRIEAAQAGLTSGLSPAFSNKVNNPVSTRYALQFYESNPLLFNQSAPAPGDLVANLTVYLKSGLPAGTRIDLLLSADPKITLFSNSGGTVSESSTNGQIALVHSCIQIGSGTGGQLPTGSSMSVIAPASRKVFVAPEVTAAIETLGEADVLVELAEPVLPGASTAQFRSANALSRESVLRRTGEGVRVRHRFETVAGFAGKINRGALQRLLHDPWVRSITFDYEVTPAACEARGAMNIGGSTTAGLTGAGVTVALIDTGIDVSHPALQNVSKAEICVAPNTCGTPTICSDRGLPGIPSCSSQSNRTVHDEYGHGTLVAGFIASQSTCGNRNTCPPPLFDAPSMRGVAPGASLVPIRIFEVDSQGNLLPAQLSDVLQALNLIDLYQDELDVDIVNMSINMGAPQSSVCDSLSPNLSEKFQDLRNKYGIALLASSGNHGHTNMISQPACFQDVIAVGALYDQAYSNPQPHYGNWNADIPQVIGCRDPIGGGLLPAACQDTNATVPINTNRIPCFSNSNQAVRLLAPGAWITTTATAGYSALGNNSDFVELAGTSFSSPLAAAAAALVSDSTGVSGEDAVSHLWSTARRAGALEITDPRNNITSRKTDVPAAIAGFDQKLYNLDRGDANGDFTRSVSDIFYLINYVFTGEAPLPRTRWGGDANCDADTTVADIFFLINHHFAGGPAPGTGCGL